MHFHGRRPWKSMKMYETQTFELLFGYFDANEILSKEATSAIFVSLVRPQCLCFPDTPGSPKSSRMKTKTPRVAGFCSLSWGLGEEASATRRSMLVIIPAHGVRSSFPGTGDRLLHSHLESANNIEICEHRWCNNLYALCCVLFTWP